MPITEFSEQEASADAHQQASVAVSEARRHVRWFHRVEHDHTHQSEESKWTRFLRLISIEFSVVQVSDTAFEITEYGSKTPYQFTDSAAGSERWITVLKELCEAWAAYLKWQVGKVKPVVPPTHERKI